MGRATEKPLYTITLDAYGQREVLNFYGLSHRVDGVVDQERQDGERLLATLDAMKNKATGY